MVSKNVMIARCLTAQQPILYGYFSRYLAENFSIVCDVIFRAMLLILPTVYRYQCMISRALMRWLQIHHVAIGRRIPELLVLWLCGDVWNCRWLVLDARRRAAHVMMPLDPRIQLIWLCIFQLIVSAFVPPIYGHVSMQINTSTAHGKLLSQIRILDVPLPLGPWLWFMYYSSH